MQPFQSPSPKPIVQAGDVAQPKRDIMDGRYDRAAWATTIIGPVSKLIARLAQDQTPDYTAEMHLELRRPSASAEVLRLMDAARVGIHAEHPLRPLRDRIRSYFLATPFEPDESSRLILWGARNPSGPLLYKDLGTLLRIDWLEGHVMCHPEFYGKRDAADLLLEWAKASGVTNLRTEAAVRRAIKDYYLQRMPKDLFPGLDNSVLEWARQVPGKNPKLALGFFMCLQRVAACRHRDMVRWRSEWLRGKGTNADAIPGASTFSRELKNLLDTNVWERIEGHSAGRKAATYRLKFEIPLGRYGVEDLARVLNVKPPAIRPR